MNKRIPQQLAGLLNVMHEPSLIQAGIDEEGEVYLIVERTNLTGGQRERLAFLMIEAAGGLLGGSTGAVLN